MLELLPLWLIFGTLCYWLAEKKGRNKVIGFFAGFLFGIFAIIYYLAVSETGKVCPFCKERIKEDATVCPHCQRELDVIKK
jgi:hypothetical protein